MKVCDLRIAHWSAPERRPDAHESDTFWFGVYRAGQFRRPRILTKQQSAGHHGGENAINGPDCCSEISAFHASRPIASGTRNQSRHFVACIAGGGPEECGRNVPPNAMRETATKTPSAPNSPPEFGDRVSRRNTSRPRSPCLYWFINQLSGIDISMPGAEVIADDPGLVESRLKRSG